jgi:hypothetical protein
MVATQVVEHRVGRLGDREVHTPVYTPVEHASQCLVKERHRVRRAVVRAPESSIISEEGRLTVMRVLQAVVDKQQEQQRGQGTTLRYALLHVELLRSTTVDDYKLLAISKKVIQPPEHSSSKTVAVKLNA